MSHSSILRWLLPFLLAQAAGAAGVRAEAPPVDAHDEDWRAQWIGHPDAMRLGEPYSLPNLWLAFREVVTLDAAPARAVARIACDSKYWLWINGEPVVFEGQLKRGPGPGDTYYDTIDLTEHLRAGDNTIAVLVWHWGRSGYSHDNSGRAGLIFDADADGRRILSDGGWKVRIHPAYGSTGEPHPGVALPEQNVLYDARLAVPGWERPGYDDGGWPAAAELGSPPVAPWNRLVPRPIPQWRDSGLRRYSNARGLPAESDGTPIVARLPYNAQVTPYLRIDAPAGLRIRVHTDTHRSSGKNSVRAVYVTREGEQEYESLGWMNGHEVHYHIPAGVRILDLKYRETGYDTEFAGRFESDDAALNTLWTKARRTLYVTMRDSYMDCPDRERAQWWGDLVIQQGQAFYALEPERAPLLARKGIREVAAWRRPDGTMTSPIPHGEGMLSPELPMQMLAAAGWYGFWTYYLYTGDRETVAGAYPAVRDYLRLWRTGGDGLVVHRAGDWDWADWGEHADVTVLENAWYYLALKAAAAMAPLAGEPGDAPLHEARMRRMEVAFDSAFWRGDGYRSAAREGPTDDRANAMAVVAGLAKPEYRVALLDVLHRERHASPYMEKYVLEALFRLDAPHLAIARMKERWAEQIASPLSTLWEQWEWTQWNGYNHGWSGGGLTVLSQYAAGVAPTSPGWAAYEVLPRMGPLRRIDAVVPTPAGDIVLGLRRDSAAFRLELTSPAGADAVAGIPLRGRDVEEVTANGVPVWRAGSAVEEGSAAAVVASDSMWIRLALPPGRWTLVATGAADEAVPPEESPRTFDVSENPVRSGRVYFSFPQRPTLAGVYTLGGTRVVDLLARTDGDLRVEWDLTNDAGSRVAAGVYLAVFRIGGEVVRRKLFVAARRE